MDHTTIYRWVQHYAPELDKRSRPHLKDCNDSCSRVINVDAAYSKAEASLKAAGILPESEELHAHRFPRDFLQHNLCTSWQATPSTRSSPLLP